MVESLAAARISPPLPREEQTLTHFDDLADFDYFGIEYSYALRAVGWLTSDRAFTTGRVSEQVFARLKELLVDPWQPSVSCGVHHCELCQYDPPRGNANLFVPNGSTIFVCPELIVHYIAAHHYRPPEKFLAAVSCCPKTRTMRYKKLLLESGGRTLVQRMG